MSRVNNTDSRTARIASFILAVAAASLMSLCFFSSREAHADITPGAGVYSGGKCSGSGVPCYSHAVWVQYKFNKNFRKNKLYNSQDIVLPNARPAWATNRLAEIAKKCIKDYDSVYVLVRPETIGGEYSGYAATSTQLRYVYSLDKNGYFEENDIPIKNRYTEGLSPALNPGKDNKLKDWNNPDDSKQRWNFKHDGNYLLKAEAMWKDDKEGNTPRGYVSWKKAHKQYEEAVRNNQGHIPKDANGKPMPWEADSKLGWFCVNDPGIELDPKSGKFESKSTVNDKKSGSKWSAVDSTAEKFTKQVDSGTQSVSVEFRHLVRAKDDPVFKKAKPKTKYKIRWCKQSGKEACTPTEKIEQSAGVTGGTWTINSNVGKNELDTHYQIKLINKRSYSFDGSDTITVCQSIAYDPKNFTVNSGGDGITGTSGKGSSKACVTLTRKPVAGFCGENGLSEEGMRVFQEGSHGDLPDTNIRHGNTTGASAVANHTAGGGWRAEVLAKPGDEIQFRHALCYGVQDVVGTRSDVGFVYPGNIPSSTNTPQAGSGGWIVYNGDSQSYKHGSSTAFSLSTNTPGYLFDQSNARVTLSPNTKQPGQLDRGKFTVLDYGFITYSPINRGGDDISINPYSCEAYGGYSQRVNAFRIPDFGSESPNNCKMSEIAKEQIGDKVRRSDVGQQISQSLSYNNQRAWVTVGNHGGPHCDHAGQTAVNFQRSEYYGGATGTGTWGYRHEICEDTGYDNAPYAVRRAGGVDTPSRYNYPVRVENLGEATQTAVVKIPYNFHTVADATITDAGEGLVYPGESVYANFYVGLKARSNVDVTGVTASDQENETQAYLTSTPVDTRVQAVTFSLPPNVTEAQAQSFIGGSTSYSSENGSDLCQYFKNKVKNSININIDCASVVKKGPQQYTVEPGGQESTVLDTTTSSSAKIDIGDVEAGTKYCVAVGISHADSHGIPDRDTSAGEGANVYSLGNTNPNWRISPAACRTVAKKPNFQVWGSIYSKGPILSTTTDKQVEHHLNRKFGSWSDTLAISQSEIKGFSSGAGLGYSSMSGNARYGGALASKTFCQLSEMSVANDKCESSGSVGKANIELSDTDNDSVLNTIRSRYMPVSTHSKTHAFAVSGDTINESDLKSFNSERNALYAYHKGDVRIGDITTNNNTNGNALKVIEVDGKATITRNVCYGTGTCNNNNDPIIRLKDRNSQIYDGISGIPQVIIIAHNIEVEENVTQVDAWLFAIGDKSATGSQSEESSTGYLDTCKTQQDVSVGGGACDKTIIFNGPVFAGELKLNRTAGAYAGGNSWGEARKDRDLASNAHAKNVANYGSLTPAEIFNLRPDAYFWGYNQASISNKATVVYSRELAPRY